MKIDPIVKKELNRLQFDPEQCLWDCHGTWVMYHRYVEIAQFACIQPTPKNRPYWDLFL